MININFFKLLIYFSFKLIILEFKLLKAKLIYLKNFFRTFSILKIVYYFFNKKIYPFKDYNTNEYLIKNHKIWPKSKYLNKNKNILVDLSLGHHPIYVISNCLIAKDLSKFTKENITAVIKKYDFQTTLIAKSFGINNIIFIKKENFFQNFYFFFKSFFYIYSKYSEKNIINFKYKNIEVGKAAYEHALRYYLDDSPKNHDFLIYLSIGKAMYSVNMVNNIFNRFKFSNYILSELQFIPNKIFFHKSLQLKIPVFARFGGGLENICVRSYRKYSDRNSFKLKYSKALVNYLVKNYKKKLKNNIDKYFKKTNQIARIGYEDAFGKYQTKPKNVNFINRKQFNSNLNIKKNIPNVLILPHVLSDNIFNCEWSLFSSPMAWYINTLKYIKKIDNVNWIIRAHPSENMYATNLNAKKIFNKIIKNKKNIILLSDKIHIKKIYNFVDAVITCHGSAGYEYTSLGIPVITTADARYTDFDFTIAPRTKNEYLKTLNNIRKIKKINSEKIFKAKLFWYMNRVACRMDHGFLPIFDPVRSFDRKKFWIKARKINNIKSLKNNNFSKNFEIQFKNKNRHTINFEFFGKINNFSKKKFYDT